MCQCPSRRRRRRPRRPRRGARGRGPRPRRPCIADQRWRRRRSCRGRAERAKARPRPFFTRDAANTGQGRAVKRTRTRLARQRHRDAPARPDMPRTRAQSSKVRRTDTQTDCGMAEAVETKIEFLDGAVRLSVAPSAGLTVAPPPPPAPPPLLPPPPASPPPAAAPPAPDSVAAERGTVSNTIQRSRTSDRSSTAVRSPTARPRALISAIKGNGEPDRLDASEREQLEARVRELLDAGARLDDVDDHGCTALAWACYF
eukprot:6373921-Prymnesium_polylepis.1